MAFDQLHADALAEAAQLRQALTEAEASYQAEIARLRDANANLIRNAEILADEVIYANADLAAAEVRGRQQGHTDMIEALRDAERFVQWAFKTRPETGMISDVCADYLVSVAASITPPAGGTEGAT